jgi:protein-S-isoprenylcysteine O-methyltransferase Ste14
MTLRTEFEQQGVWLFRWRSYVPVPLLVLVAAKLWISGYPPERLAPSTLWNVVALALGALGIVIRAKAVGHAPRGTSGRNVLGQVAEVLNTTGMYSIMRHPLYVGNALMWLAVAAMARSVWLLVVISLLFWVYYERIMFAEEEFLRRKFGRTYEEWAARTPAFLPATHGWRAPSLPFSTRTVLRREYSGVMGMIGAMAFLDFVGNLRGGRATLDPLWAILLVACTVLYLALRTMKHRTGWLEMEGR